MDHQTFEDLMFTRILLAVAEHCQTSRGRELIVQLRPARRRADAEAEIALVEEARNILDLPEHPSLEGAEDLTGSVQSASKGGVLTAAELMAAARFIRIGEEALTMITCSRLRAPLLASAFSDIRDLSFVAERIENTFDEDGRIRDDASPCLYELREKASRLSRRVKEHIESMLRDSQVKELLQDDYYTLRDGRYVLPVKAEDHRLMSGIIHGTSRTGATFYIEPMAIVEDNNQLKVTLDQIEAEEAAVLADRSALLGRFVREFEELSFAIWRLDTILAKARFARHLRASRPRIGGKDESLSLVDARNPILLLLGREVVPITLSLPHVVSGLVISGPNAGGKSVTLSTIGLCCLMVRHGLLPPVAQQSLIPWYENIYTVMGDPTSMDRAVSTFTGQLIRLSEVFRRNSGRTLVLVDELATGTEPKRGEALAVATVKALVESGAECIVTTHFEALKQLALEDSRFANARVGLDPVKKVPNYRLETGTMGESNPFEIAMSVGFPKTIIETAEALIDQRERKLDEMIIETSRLREELEKRKAELEEEKKKAVSERRRYEKELARLRGEADRLVFEARRDVLQKMKLLEEELAQIAKQARAEKEATKIIVKRAEVREKKTIVRTDMEREMALVEKDFPVEPLPADELKEGARVFVTGLRADGNIVSVAPDGKRVVVQVGQMRMQVKVADLRRPRTPDTFKKPTSTKLTYEDQQRDETTFVRSDRNTVDVRGMRVDDAIMAVEKKLDEALLTNEPVVLIIHGMGTSAIRKAVREYLKTSRYARSFRPGGPGEGGEGVTFVKL